MDAGEASPIYYLGHAHWDYGDICECGWHIYNHLAYVKFFSYVCMYVCMYVW